VIIPLSHEGPEGRSLPYATFAFDLLNALAFLATHSAIEDESHQIGGLETRILLIAALIDKSRRGQAGILDYS